MTGLSLIVVGMLAMPIASTPPEQKCEYTVVSYVVRGWSKVNPKLGTKKFIAFVQEHIDEGWKPQGGVSYGAADVSMHQAMTRGCD